MYVLSRSDRVICSTARFNLPVEVPESIFDTYTKVPVVICGVQSHVHVSALLLQLTEVRSATTGLVKEIYSVSQSYQKSPAK